MLSINGPDPRWFIKCFVEHLKFIHCLFDFDVNYTSALSCVQECLGLSWFLGLTYKFLSNLIKSLVEVHFTLLLLLFKMFFSKLMMFFFFLYLILFKVFVLKLRERVLNWLILLLHTWLILLFNKCSITRAKTVLCTNYILTFLQGQFYWLIVILLFVLGGSKASKIGSWKLFYIVLGQ